VKVWIEMDSGGSEQGKGRVKGGALPDDIKGMELLGHLGGCHSVLLS
jgi:hypothetical protein